MTLNEYNRAQESLDRMENICKAICDETADRRDELNEFAIKALLKGAPLLILNAIANEIRKAEAELDDLNGLGGEIWCSDVDLLMRRKEIVA